MEPVDHPVHGRHRVLASSGEAAGHPRCDDERTDVSDRVLTDRDRDRITTATWTRARRALEEGRIDEGIELLDESVERWHDVQWFLVNRITSLLSFVADELGEEAVERALRRTGEEFIRGRRDTGVDWATLPANVRAKVMARAFLTNFGEVAVDEDDEKVTLSIACGTGGRLVEEGRYEGDDSYVTLREKAPRTFMMDALPVYCAHCSVNNEMQPIEWGGTPLSVEHPTTERGERCVHHIYKDLGDVPEEEYARVGKTRPGLSQP